MDIINDTKRLDKKVQINRYMDSYGVIAYKKLYENLLFYLILFFNMSLIGLIILNQIINNGTLDYFAIGSIYERQIVEIGKYIFINSMGVMNEVVNIINFITMIINDNFNITIPKIYFEVQSYNLNLNIGSYIALFSSILFLILMHVLIFYQSRKQIILRYSGITTFYIPFLLLPSWFNRYKNEYVYIKLITKLRDQRIDKETHIKLIEKIFKKDSKNYELEIKEKDILNLYHYTSLKVVPKEQKSNQKKENKNDTNKQKKIQGHNKRTKNKPKIPAEFG
jgi:hypothetical protein